MTTRIPSAATAEGVSAKPLDSLPHIEAAMEAMTPEEFADFQVRIQPILKRAERRQAKEAAR